jgi:hypothetical protein
MTARCHWCRHVFGVNEQIANGAVPDAVLPFHIKKDDAVARIRQFVDKRRMFALKAFKDQFTPENVVGVFLPYMIVDSNVSAAVAGKGEIKTREYTVGSEKNKRTLYDADVYQVERQVDFTVDDLPLESSAERGNLDTRANTNNIINTILPFDTKNAVKWNASYLAGFTSEKRNLDVEKLRPRLEDQLLSIARAGGRFGEALQPWRALGTGTAGGAWHPLGVDVPAGVAVLVPPARQERRHAALHRGERPYRRNHGQRARAAMEDAAGGAGHRHRH